MLSITPFLTRWKAGRAKMGADEPSIRNGSTLLLLPTVVARTAFCPLPPRVALVTPSSALSRRVAAAGGVSRRRVISNSSVRVKGRRGVSMVSTAEPSLRAAAGSIPARSNSRPCICTTLRKVLAWSRRFGRHQMRAAPYGAARIILRAPRYGRTPRLGVTTPRLGGTQLRAATAGRANCAR